MCDLIIFKTIIEQIQKIAQNILCFVCCSRT